MSANPTEVIKSPLRQIMARPIVVIEEKPGAYLGREAITAHSPFDDVLVMKVA